MNSSTSRDTRWYHQVLLQPWQYVAWHSPPFRITEWSTHLSTPRLCTENSQSLVDLDSASFRKVATTPDHHSLQLSNAIHSSKDVLRLSTLRLMHRERYSSATFTSKIGKSASRALRYFLHNLNLDDLEISQSMRWYTTVSPSMRETQGIATFYRLFKKKR